MALRMAQSQHAATKLGPPAPIYDISGFQPTNDRLDNNLSDYFGPIANNGYVPMRNQVETYHLPDAYAGKSEYLGATSTNLLLGRNDFLVNSILPWKFSLNQHVHWHQFQFDRTFADVSAEESIPRLVTTEKSEGSASLLRRGIALRVEHGFASTPAGRQEYELKLAAIICASSEIIHQTALLALLESPSSYVSCFVDVHEARCLYDYFAKDLFFFGCMQKNDHGFFLLDKEVNAMTNPRGVKPDTYIVPSGMSVYAQVGDASEINYNTAGPDARSNLKSREQIKTLGGKTIMETFPYELDNSMQCIDQLNRERRIGGHFSLRYWEAGRVDDWKSKYRSEKCNTDIYCAEDDSYHTITLRQCISNLKDMCAHESGSRGSPFRVQNGSCGNDGMPRVLFLGNDDRMMYGDAIGYERDDGSGSHDCQSMKFNAACEVYAASVLGWDEKADPDGIQDDAARSGVGYFPVSGDTDAIENNGKLCVGQHAVLVSNTELLKKADMFYRHGPGSLHPLLSQELADKAQWQNAGDVRKVMDDVFGTLGVSAFGDLEFLLSSAGEGNAAFRRALAGVTIADFFNPNTPQGAFVGNLAPSHLRYDGKNDAAHEEKDVAMITAYLGQHQRNARLNAAAPPDPAAFVTEGVDSVQDDTARHRDYTQRLTDWGAAVQAAFADPRNTAAITTFAASVPQAQSDMVKPFMRQIRGLLRNNFIQALRRVLLPETFGGSTDLEYSRNLGILVHAMEEEHGAGTPSTRELAAICSKRIQGAFSLDNGACKVDNRGVNTMQQEKLHVTYDMLPVLRERRNLSAALAYAFSQPFVDGFERLARKGFADAMASRNTVFCAKLRETQASMAEVIGKKVMHGFMDQTVASILTGDPLDVFMSTAAARTMHTTIVMTLYEACHGDPKENETWYTQAHSILADLVGYGNATRGSQHSAPAVLLALMAIMCDKVSGFMGPRIGASFTETTFKLLTSLLYKCHTKRVAVGSSGRLFMRVLCEFGAFAALRAVVPFQKAQEKIGQFWTDVESATGDTTKIIDGYHVVPGLDARGSCPVDLQTLQFYDVVSWFAMWTDFTDLDEQGAFVYSERDTNRTDYRNPMNKMQACYLRAQGGSKLGSSSAPYETHNADLHAQRSNVLGLLGNIESSVTVEDIAIPPSFASIIAHKRPAVTEPSNGDVAAFELAFQQYSQFAPGDYNLPPGDYDLLWTIARPDVNFGKGRLDKCSAFKTNGEPYTAYYTAAYMPQIMAGVNVNHALTYGDPCMFHADAADVYASGAARLIYEPAIRIAAADSRNQTTISDQYRMMVEGAHMEWIVNGQDCPCPDAKKMEAMRMPEYGCAHSGAYAVGYALMSQTHSDGTMALARHSAEGFKKGEMRQYTLTWEGNFMVECQQLGLDLSAWKDKGQKAYDDVTKAGSNAVHVHQPLDAWPYTSNSFHCAGAKRLPFVSKIRRTYRSKHGKCNGGQGGNGRGKYFNDVVEYMCKPLSFDALEADIDLDRPLPVSVLCLRLWRTYKCGSMIACARGESLGRTLYGYADVQCADDVVSKTHLLHFTFQHASVVTNPDAVVTVPDVFIGAYVTGESHKFFKGPLGSPAEVTDKLEREGQSIVPLLCLDPFYGDEVMTSAKNGTGIPHPLFVGGADANDLMSDESESSKFKGHCNESWNQLDPLARNFARLVGVADINGPEHSLDDDTIVMHFQAPYTSLPQSMNQFAFQEVQYMQVDNRRRYIADKGHLPSEARRPGSAKVFNGHYAGLCRADIRETCL